MIYLKYTNILPQRMQVWWWPQKSLHPPISVPLIPICHSHWCSLWLKQICTPGRCLEGLFWLKQLFTYRGYCDFFGYFAFQFYKALVGKMVSESPIEVNYWSLNRGFAHNRGASCICTWLRWVDRLNCQTVFKHTLSVSDLCFRLVLVFKQSLSVSRQVTSLCQPPTLLVEGSLRHMLDEHTFAQSIWTTNKPLVLMCTPVLLNSLLPGKHTS